ncbi:MAG: glycosyltransferase, partial [Gemmatimonadetes bacterium]|nr:glycosyltransferase [Gemmatimonadota bacterium]
MYDPSPQAKAEALTISVIMPVYNGSAFLRQSLPPLIAMRDRAEVLEVIVVDDTSSDNTAAMAITMGATVIPSGGRFGPGAARNLAAARARGQVLWFVDADVVAHGPVAEQLQAAFEDPNIVGVFGSYDDNPPARNFLSQYKNLTHHYYHQRGKREASTFWAGCGAIRKDIFIAVGGFDTQRYTRPSIEDIELGYRLRVRGGRILLIPELQATHLKEWRFFDLIRTEIFGRALPWSRLILNRSGLIDDLNVTRSEQLRALVAAALCLSIASIPIASISWWWPLGQLLVAVLANKQLARLFYRRNGLIFAFGGVLFHQVYYLYSSAAYTWCWIEHRLSS